MPKTQGALALKTVAEVSVRLVKEKEATYDGVELRKGTDVARFLQDHMRDLDREHFLVLTVNTRNRLISFSVAAIGTLDAVMIKPREIFKVAILQNAHSVILAHNHPSGDPCPSDNDLEVTETLIDAGRILQIPVLDHVVLGSEGSFVSIRESIPAWFG